MDKQKALGDSSSEGFRFWYDDDGFDGPHINTIPRASEKIKDYLV
jgi:hypothetical protein